MGFACPVCEIPHQDATHLANHLAFTAMTHGDDHEAWLDEAVPGWVDHGEADLAAEVSDLAPEAEYEQVFEDTVGGRGGGGADQYDHGHDHGTEQSGPPAGIDPASAAATGGGELDEAARAALDEARALTAEMLDGGTDSVDNGESGSTENGEGGSTENGEGGSTENGEGGSTENGESDNPADTGAEPGHSESAADGRDDGGEPG